MESFSCNSVHAFLCENIILTPLNTFLKELEPSFCGDHFNRFSNLVYEATDFPVLYNDQSSFFYLLKNGLPTNSSSCFVSDS